MLFGSPERYKGPHAVPMTPEKSGNVRRRPQAVHQENLQKKESLRREFIIGSLSGIGALLGILALKSALEKSNSKSVQGEQLFQPEEVLQEGIQILEATVEILPEAKIRISPVADLTTIFTPSLKYAGKVLKVINPESVAGVSTTGDLKSKETWLSFEMENLFGIKTRVYVNNSPDVVRIVEAPLGETNQVKVSRVRRGNYEFLRKENGEEITPTSVSIQETKNLPKQPKFITRRELFSSIAKRAA